jgi:hypothetical protein
MAFLVPFVFVGGPATTAGALAHVMLADYVPFIILLTALFTVAGGISIGGNLHGSPARNTGLMLIGAALASFMGTTGASMLMIRPLIRANDNRRHSTHVVVFFIFIVANAGGSLTPLGDPPLFLGFLAGVEFFWTARHVFPQTLFLVGTLLALFYAIDAWHFRKEGVMPRDPTPDSRGVRIAGRLNIVLLFAIMGLVLLSGTWRPGVSWVVMGTDIALEKLVRDGALIGVTLLSLSLTRPEVHEENQFSWGRGGQAVRRHLRDHRARARHAEGRRQRRVRTRRRAGHRCSRPADPRDVLLGLRPALLVPRQRPDLPGVLPPRRRRPESADDDARARAGGNLAGIGVHGGQHVHRERAELHGEGGRGGSGRPDAELLRLHGLVGSRAVAPVRGDDADLLLRIRFELSRSEGARGCP